jgi:hypothetical protein
VAHARGVCLPDVVVVEVRQQVRRAPVLEETLQLAPGRLRARARTAPLPRRLEVAEDLVEVLFLVFGVDEVVVLFVVEAVFRLFAHAADPVRMQPVEHSQSDSVAAPL